MDVDRELDHLVGRYCFAPIFGMWQPGVREVESGIEFFCRKCGVGRIHHGILPIDRLKKPLSMDFIRFLFDMAIVFCFRFFIVQALFVRMKHNVISSYTARNVFLAAKKYGLWNMV